MLEKKLEDGNAFRLTDDDIHRLHLPHSDRIMVLDGGRLAEFDTPARLRANPASLFSQLCASAANE